MTDLMSLLILLLSYKLIDEVTKYLNAVEETPRDRVHFAIEVSSLHNPIDLKQPRSSATFRVIRPSVRTLPNKWNLK